MGPRLGERTRIRIFAVAGLVLAVLAADRLTHVPSATAILNDSDRTWSVPVGHELVIAGPLAPELLHIETAAGDGVKLEAGPVLLPGRDQRVGQLVWLVSRPEHGGTTDNKVGVSVGLERTGKAATLTLGRSGTETQPELLLGSPNAPLRVNAGVVFGDLAILPPTAILADGKRLDDPAIAFEFTLLPGGDMSLTFPTFADGTPKGLTMEVGTPERRGPRLWLRELDMRQEGAGRPRRVACAAQPDATLWSTILRGSSLASGADCASERRLALTALAIKEDSILVDLAGTAYLYDAEQPTISRFFRWARDNPVLGALMGAVFAGLAAWVFRVFTARPS